MLEFLAKARRLIFMADVSQRLFASLLDLRPISYESFLEATISLTPTLLTINARITVFSIYLKLPRAVKTTVCLITKKMFNN